MEEILPGVFHWTSFHEGIGEEVHSHYVRAGRPAFLIDPRVPDAGIEWFEERPRPERVYLTNRHHYRHSDQFQARFASIVWCHRAGLHEFDAGQGVEPFEHGDELAGGALALEINALCPEETAFYIPQADGILAVGDALVRDRERLALVPDPLLGDDPPAVKRALREALLRLVAERAFEHVLFAHGAPWIGGAREALHRFAEDLAV